MFHIKLILDSNHIYIRFFCFAFIYISLSLQLIKLIDLNTSNKKNNIFCFLFKITFFTKLILKRKLVVVIISTSLYIYICLFDYLII